MTKQQLTYLLDLTFALTQKELKAKYKTTTFGFLWIIINPLIQMIVLTFVFSFFLRISIPNYPLFVFSGLLPWMYFTLSIQTGTSSLVGNRDIIKKVNFPRELLPISSILAHLEVFLIAFVLLIGYILLTSGFHSSYLLLIPLVILQTFFSIALSLMFSSFDIYYRDVSFGLQALLIPWFYLTPIFYTLSMIPNSFFLFYKLNPMVGIITTYQAILVDWKYFDFSALLISCLATFLFSIIGYTVFQKRSPYFAEWI